MKLKTKRQILPQRAYNFFVQTTLPSNSVKLCLQISVPLSLSMRGRQCRNQQFMMPILPEKLITSELAIVNLHFNTVNFQS